MEVYIERTKETKQLEFRGVAKELLHELGFTSEEVLIIKNNELVTEEENLEDTDNIKLLSIISGG